jgi:hypothetical protein
MAEGKSKSIYDSTLDAQVQKLIADNKAISEAGLSTGTGRVWIHGSNDYELTDISGLKNPFKREDLQANYAIVMLDPDPGTAADKVAIKFQSDYLAAMERAYRLRHTGLVRTEVFSAMRRKLQADTNLLEFTKANFERMRLRGE